MTHFTEQQLLGFLYVKRGYSLIDLIVNMGLSKKEWEQIKSEGNLDITDTEMQEVEEYFRSGLK